MKLGKQGLNLILSNKELLYRIHRLSGKSSAMVFKMNDNLPISIIESGHLNMVNFMRVRGTHTIRDDKVSMISALETYSK